MKRSHLIIILIQALFLCACSGSGDRNKPQHKASEKADSLLEASYTASDNGEFSQAQILGERALAIYTEAKDTVKMSECYTLLCACYARTSNTDRAIEMSVKALRIDSIKKDYESMGSNYNNLAAVYLTINDVEHAKTFIDRSLEMDRLSGTNKNESAHLGIACEVYNNLGRHDEALSFAKQAYEMDAEEGDSLKMARRMSQMGDVYVGMENYILAEQNFLAADRLMKSTPENISVCINLKQLGKVYIKMGRREEAVKMLEKSRKMAQKMNLKYLMQQNLEMLAGVYKDSDPRLAVAYLQTAGTLKDSIHSERTCNMKENYAALYESIQKQNTINKQQAQLSVHKMLTWGSVALVLLLLFLCMAMFYIVRLRSKQQKMAERTNSIQQDFLKNITYEFRTPLTVIKGQADLLKASETDARKLSGYDTIMEQSDVLLNLINQLIEISRAHTDYNNKVWLSGNAVALTRMVIENMRIHAEKKLITLVFESKQPYIEMDFVPGFMRNILRNLISNSLKFTPRGGMITITMRSEGGRIVTNVADTGIGISPDDLPHIFDPYYRGKNEEANLATGVSLSLTKQMVLAMNGSMEVKSIEGRGTLFTFSIPLRHSDRELPHWMPSMFSPGTVVVEPGVKGTTGNWVEEYGRDDEKSDKPQVLLVEDNAEVAQYMRALLGGKYRVMYAMNGREALAKAMEYVPDIIVTDLMMPEMDGYELCRNVRASALLNHVPLIIVTAHAEHENLLKAFELGADAYIAKPFNSKELMMRVEKLLQQRQLLKEKYSNAMLDDCVEKVDTTAADQKFMSKLHQILQANMSDTGLGSALVAEKMFISQRQLNRKVKLLTNVDTTTYIREFRILFAKQMLKNTNSSITDIYIQCGFDSPSYFSKIFKQSTGMTPTEYRKKNV
ncbi:MAG: response regulator [Prevotella sp.]|uniref:response regulator n=1 Tax=Prevotella sp. TaxID=59823 RepID=UPI002A34B1D4|nr:response regulator [Prevotella sp.]MDD7317301.1 response regulator [Prevotellaceae bacterium]MDY4019905.1 response regulator [Prevotella sp.]